MYLPFMLCKLLYYVSLYFLASVKYSLHFKGGQYVNEFKIKKQGAV